MPKLGFMLLFVCTTLTGCLVDNATQMYNNTEIRYNASNQLVLMPGDRLYSTFEQINQYYIGTEQCMGLYAPGPTLWYVDFQKLGSVWTGEQDDGWGLSGAKPNGIWYSGTGVDYLIAANILPPDYQVPYDTPGFVFINTNDHIVPNITYDYRSEATDREALKHEFVHHILHALYIKTDDGSSHGLVGGIDYFKRCGPGVNVDQ